MSNSVLIVAELHLDQCRQPDCDALIRLSIDTLSSLAALRALHALDNTASMQVPLNIFVNFPRMLSGGYFSLSSKVVYRLRPQPD